MFPLMMMPHKVEVITTKEIFLMAMDKLACNLGWTAEVIAEHFSHIEAVPGKTLNYFGLVIEPHVTVHSIPTIGATFSTRHKESKRELCIVVDNNSLDSARALNKEGLVRDSTLNTLEKLFESDYHMLIADGGAGEIHGNPADALKSQAERIIFVHVEQLPPKFNNTFSLASSGKRYTVFEGDSSIYTSQVSHYLSAWLGRPFPNRWMRSLLAQEEIRKYNADDVIVVQGSVIRGSVYLVLTGYCEVVRHDGEQSNKVAHLQAGDLIGEMALITGQGSRNASVVASTPVTICVFSEETFGAFIENEGFKDHLLRRWSIRPVIRNLPQFNQLSSTVTETVGRSANFLSLAEGESMDFGEEAWYLLDEGKTLCDAGQGKEFGWCPLSTENIATVTAVEPCSFVYFNRDDFEALRLSVPQLNYMLRKLRISQNDECVDWILGVVPIR
jgi:CRP-like cAMP-binding protein